MMQLRRDDPGSTASIAYQVWARGAMEEGYSWKARAFAEDVNRFMCDSWPPRSYSCSFCEREFRSAQALGGHMNVHRRDRARLCQSPPSDPSPTCAAQPTTISPVDYTSRLCLLYPIPAATSSLRPPPSLICPLISASPSLVSTPLSCPPDSPLSSTSLSHLTPGLPPACSLPTHLKPPFSASMQYLSSPLPSLDSQCATFCTQSLNLARLSDSPNCVPQSIFHHDRERSREKSGIEAFHGYYALSQKGQKTLNITGLSQDYAFSDDVSVADSVDLELRLGQKP